MRGWFLLSGAPGSTCPQMSPQLFGKRRRNHNKLQKPSHEDGWTIEGSMYLYWEILILQQITQLYKAQERSPSYVPEGSKRCKTEASVLLTLGTGCVRHNVKWNMTFYQIRSIYTFYHLAVLHSDFLQKAFLYHFKKLSKRKACYTLLFYLNIPWSERKRGTLLTPSCCLWKEELIIEPRGCLNRDRLPHLFLRC